MRAIFRAGPIFLMIFAVALFGAIGHINSTSGFAITDNTGTIAAAGDPYEDYAVQDDQTIPIYGPDIGADTAKVRLMPAVLTDTTPWVIRPVREYDVVTSMDVMPGLRRADFVIYDNMSPEQVRKWGGDTYDRLYVLRL